MGGSIFIDNDSYVGEYVLAMLIMLYMFYLSDATQLP